MKRTKLLLTAAIIAATIPAIAKQVTPDQALCIAQAHFMKSAPRHAPGAIAKASRPRLVLDARDAQGATSYYVFNTDAGFVVVAGDDRAVPVLGYSVRGAFDRDNMPAALQYMLDLYAHEMAYLRTHPDIEPCNAPAVRETEVKPLLKSNWAQKEPYNRLCPALDGSDEKCATGCVATAAAQIAYYHRCPSSGSRTYDWDNMLDNYVEGSYTDEQAQAVAQLMADLGTSAEMKYGKTSATSNFKMLTAMRDEYGFSKAMRLELRPTMTTTEWEDLIVAELDAKRPVLYSGYTETGGHTFVVDGYDKKGYFHVNWGWNALSNGYFVLSILSPRAQGTGSYNGGYNNCQSMVIGIAPDAGAPEPEKYLQVTADDFGPENEKKTEVNLGEALTFSFSGLTAMGQGYGNGVDVTIAYVLTDVSNNNPKVMSYEASYAVKFGNRNASNGNRFDVNPGKDLAPGEYHLHMMYKCPQAGIDQYRPIDRSQARPGYLVARVADGKMTFSRPNAGHKGLRVVKFDLPTTFVDNDFITVPLTIVNDGEEYSDEINIAIKSPGESEFTDRFSEVMSLPTGREMTLELVFSIPRPVGTHYIMLRDINGRVLDGPRAIVTEAADTYTLAPASQLTLEDVNVTSGVVKATIDVKNNGAKDFNGSLFYRITTSERTWASNMTAPVSIPAGATATATISTPFEGQPGMEYTLELHSLTAETPEAQAQRKATFKVGVNTAVTDINAGKFAISVNGDLLTIGGATKVAVYNVAGALIGTAPAMRLPRGIYIVVADGVTRKVAVNRPGR